MPLNSYFAWVYFERTGRPEKIVAKSFKDFIEQLDRLVERNGEMPEWINKVYR